MAADNNSSNSLADGRRQKSAYKMRDDVLLGAVERWQHVVRRQVDFVVVEVLQHRQEGGWFNVGNVDDVFASVSARQAAVKHCVEHSRTSSKDVPENIVLILQFS